MFHFARPIAALTMPDANYRSFITPGPSARRIIGKLLPLIAAPNLQVMHDASPVSDKMRKTWWHTGYPSWQLLAKTVTVCTLNPLHLFS